MVLKPKASVYTVNTVWEWCKSIWYSNIFTATATGTAFENDVKVYGTQTNSDNEVCIKKFENDVKVYGTQTTFPVSPSIFPFENDVKVYGTQTVAVYCPVNITFENDVKVYGTQTHPWSSVVGC